MCTKISFLEDLCYQTLTGNSVAGTKKSCDLLVKSETTKKKKKNQLKTNTEKAMDKLFQWASEMVTANATMTHTDIEYVKNSDKHATVKLLLSQFQTINVESFRM